MEGFDLIQTKEMKALSVKLNERSWTLALKNPGVLNATVCVLDVPRIEDEEIELTMGGLDSKAGYHAHWPKQK